MSIQRPPADILKLNAWMKEYAAKTGAVYADYYSALVDDKGMLKDGISADGLHPNPKGFELMAPVAEPPSDKRCSVRALDPLWNAGQVLLLLGSSAHRYQPGSLTLGQPLQQHLSVIAEADPVPMLAGIHAGLDEDHVFFRTHVQCGLQSSRDVQQQQLRARRNAHGARHLPRAEPCTPAAHLRPLLHFSRRCKSKCSRGEAIDGQLFTFYREPGSNFRERVIAHRSLRF